MYRNKMRKEESVLGISNIKRVGEEVLPHPRKLKPETIS